MNILVNLRLTNDIFVDGTLTITDHELADVMLAYLPPSLIYKPKVYQDGNSWIALYGEDLATGVVGCGQSPFDAVKDFDETWAKRMKT